MVSVLVLNWNGRRYLGECLTSLIRDACPHIEVVLVDNGSTDDSRKVAEQFAGVRVIAHQANLGFSRGYNDAVPAARGQFLVFLNNDTAAQAGWLPPLIDVLRGNPLVGITGSMQLFYGTGLINSVGGAFKLWTGCTDLGYGLPESAYEGRQFVDAFYASGAAMAISRELFERLGGFDEYFFAYSEDLDLSWRARLLGFKIRTVPESVVLHHHSGTWGVFNPKRVRMVTHNQVVANIGCLSRMNLVHALPAYAAFSLLKAAAMAISLRNFGFVMETAGAFADCVRHRRAIWQRRQKIQTTRRVSDRQALRCESAGLIDPPWVWVRIMRTAVQVQRARESAASP